MAKVKINIDRPIDSNQTGLPSPSLPMTADVTPASPSPASKIPVIFGTRPSLLNNIAATTPIGIPLPNLNDVKSREQYVTNFVKKYGNVFHGYGDLPLNVNQIPRGGSDTMKNISTKYAKQYGIDPALLYSSSMVEGASGLFKSQATGLDSKNRKPGSYGYQDNYGDKDFPINGGQSFGFQTFAERFPDLVKAGYLPKEFASQFRGTKAATADPNELHDANNFKTVEGAMQAKAALLKYHADDIDKFAKQNNITLTPKEREFFMLAGYNGGEGTAHKKLLAYHQAGLLGNDKFLQSRPDSDQAVRGTYMDVYGHVMDRMKMRDAFKNEKLF